MDVKFVQCEVCSVSHQIGMPCDFCTKTADGKRMAKVLSIRQPWAWLIVNGFKDIENRNWNTKLRGKFLIHASMRIDEDAYHRFKDTFKLPSMGFLVKQIGGIVGGAELVDVVTESDSIWKDPESKYGFVLKNRQKLPFRKIPGKLGFFTIDIDEVYSDHR